MGLQACLAKRSDHEDEYDKRNRYERKSQIAGPELAHLKMKDILSR